MLESGGVTDRLPPQRLHSVCVNRTDESIHADCMSAREPLWKSRTGTTKTKRPPGFPWAASEAQSATGKNRLGVALRAGDVRAIETLGRATRQAQQAEKTRIHGRSRFMPHARAPSAPWLLGQERRPGVGRGRERGLNGREHGWSLCGNWRSDVCQTKRFNRRSLL